jgi:hypothetical protein
MKAEHRKELETNSLAEGVGNLLRRAQTSPQRSMLAYVLLITVIVGAIFLTWRWVQWNRVEAASRWLDFLDGNRTAINDLATKYTETPAGKAALLEENWLNFWESGLKNLGRQPISAIRSLDFIKQAYEGAVKVCEGDPNFEPEARFGLAMVLETLAVQDRTKLQEAKAELEKAKAFDKSAFGKMAADRLAIYNDANKYAELVRFYSDLQRDLMVPDRAEMRNNPAGDLVPPQPKAKPEKKAPAPEKK